MEQNGSSAMYNVRQIYDLDLKLDLPKCMYTVKNIYGENHVATTGDGNFNEQNIDEVEKHQLSILKKLEDLKNQIVCIKKEFNISSSDATNVKQMSLLPAKYQDIVIKANPDYPPFSIWVYHNLLRQSMQIQLVTYCHSSLMSLPESVQCMTSLKDTCHCDLTFTVIWSKSVGKDVEMMIDPVHQSFIEGEVNIARYIWRSFFEDYDKDPFVAAEIDNWLEMAHNSLVHGSIKDRNTLLKSINSELAKTSYLVGNRLTIVDIVFWSLIRQCQPTLNVPPNVAKWLKNLDSCPTFKIPMKN